MLINPYITDNPVGDKREVFIGREDVLNTVINEVINHPSQNAMVLYGQRRIGKTSVLQALKARLEGKAYHTVCISSEGHNNIDFDELLLDLAKRISNSDKPEGLQGTNPNNIEQNFSDWLITWFKQLPETKLVLLIDEFDSLQANAAQKFFPYLQRLLGEHPSKLKCVFVIGRDINDLTAQAYAPFAKTLSKKISLLSSDQAEQLITLSNSEVSRTLEWPRPMIDEVKSLTNGHPFFIALLCYHIWEICQENSGGENNILPTVTRDKLERAISYTLEAQFHDWQYIWNGLPPAGKVMASALAEEEQERANFDTLLHHILNREAIAVIMRELEAVPKLLKDWDLIEPIEPEGTEYRFRVRLICRWIRKYKPLEKVQVELDRLEPAAETLYEAGEKLEQEGAIDHAIRTLRQAIELNPGHIRANRLLAQILARQRKFDEARQVLDDFTRYNLRAATPLLITVLLALAENSSDQEKLKYYSRILALNPDHPQASQLAQETKKRIEEKRRRPIELIKRFSMSHAKKLIQVAGTLVILVVTYLAIEKFYYPVGIVLEVDSQEQLNYQLMGISSSEKYQLEAIQIQIESDVAPQESTFSYKNYAEKKVEKKEDTAQTYQVDTNWIRQKLPNIDSFEYPSQENIFSFTFQFQFEDKTDPKLVFGCSAISTQQTKIDCKVKQRGYASLLRGIPWWLIGSVASIIFIVLIELVWAWRNRERDDEL